MHLGVRKLKIQNSNYARNAERILASTNFYACTEHQDNYLDSYFSALDEVYKLIYKSENGNINIDELLDDEVCHSGFKRLINEIS